MGSLDESTMTRVTRSLACGSASRRPGHLTLDGVAVAQCRSTISNSCASGKASAARTKRQAAVPPSAPWL